MNKPGLTAVFSAKEPRAVLDTAGTVAVLIKDQPRFDAWIMPNTFSEGRGWQSGCPEVQYLSVLEQIPLRQAFPAAPQAELKPAPERRVLNNYAGPISGLSHSGQVAATLDSQRFFASHFPAGPYSRGRDCANVRERNGGSDEDL